MTKYRKYIIPLLLALLLAVTAFFPANTSENDYISYAVDLKKDALKLYWKNEAGRTYGSLLNLKNQLEKKKEKLLFAMNGGMYTRERSPLGLYIENGETLQSLNKKTGKGNFYLSPNGVFYFTSDHQAQVCTTKDFRHQNNILYATQSGPMLLVDGKIHPAFKKDSKHLNIRNGVGILPGGKIVFAMSKNEVSFYDFAQYFQELGCKNALYLDGYVSRAWVPEKNWEQKDGNFGVIIGVTEAMK